MPGAFFLGRVHLLGAFENKYEEAIELIQNTKTIYRRGFQYSIIDLEIQRKKIEPEGTISFVFGRIIRHRDETEEVKKDLSTVTVSVPDEVSADVYFCYCPQYSIVAYKIRNIHNRVFQIIFGDLLESGRDGFMVSAGVEPINQFHQFLQKIRELDKINKISFSLHPSNPNHRERWREVDEELRDQKIGTWWSSIFPQKGGSIELHDNSHLMKSLYMCADGYGHSTVTGEQDGQPIKLRSTEESQREFETGDDVESRSDLEKAIITEKIIATQTELKDDEAN